jgi:hypothetical protein
MSYTVPTHHVQQFSANVRFLAAQEMSLLRRAVIEERITGDRLYINQLGSSKPVKVAARHADTPFTPLPHARRRIVPYSYDWMDLIDRDDELRMLADLTSRYARRGAEAMALAMDQEIIGAAFGPAYTGQDGTTVVNFPTTPGNVVAVNSWAYETGTGNVGLTVSKVIEAGVKLDAGLRNRNERRFFACSAHDMGSLVGTTKATSVDYVNVKALVEGRVPTLYRFEFIVTEELPLDGSGHRRCIAWAESGIGLGIASDVVTTVDRRPDKRNATQIYVTMDIGAARLEEAKVIEVKTLVP